MSNSEIMQDNGGERISLYNKCLSELKLEDFEIAPISSVSPDTVKTLIGYYARNLIASRSVFTSASSEFENLETAGMVRRFLLVLGQQPITREIDRRVLELFEKEGVETWFLPQIEYEEDSKWLKGDHFAYLDP